MAQNNEQLERFIDAVKLDIDGKVNDIINQANVEKDEILAEAERKKSEAAQRHYNENSKKYGKQYMRNVSKSELEIKKQVLRYRDERVDELFKGVEKRIMEYRNTSEYVDSLVKAVISTDIAEDTIIFLAVDDMKYQDEINKSLKGKNVVFRSDKTILLGGVSIYNQETGVIVDKTYDSAFRLEQRKFNSKNVFAGKEEVL